MHGGEQWVSARKYTYVRRRGIALQIWLDGLVLLVKVRQVRDEILDDVGVRERVDLDIRGRLGRDSAYSTRHC